MKRGGYIPREKRLYNKWVASDTLEDFALRYTADKARRWSAGRVANTAIGATAFLACEAIGASITLSYGFANAVPAIIAAMVVMFLISAPIAYSAAKEGLDIDLLTRGAGFGYLGSTLTSLIYASFTFLLFALEASIMSTALEAALGIPLQIAHVISTLIVIPIAIYGMTAITRFQALTQPVWIVLQILPIAYLLWKGGPAIEAWTIFPGDWGGQSGTFDIIMFGLAFSTILSLLPQIGEQADYLRFLPQKSKTTRLKWWAAVLLSGPGWTLVGGVKLLLGSVLAVYLLQQNIGDAANPTQMFRTVFGDIFSSGQFGLLATGVFVIVCQMKINVTNGYAGSIAWSNFFSRLTHSHPGRVVWLVFNVVLALLLMEIGIFNVIDEILVLYANLAAGWIGALVADLVVSKPMGWSPREIEFKRAHLKDINPVGVGAMLISIFVSGAMYSGVAGETAKAFAPFIGFWAAFISAPIIAWRTRGEHYIARKSDLSAYPEQVECVICENSFQHADMAFCSMYEAPICSLCCTLEVRCEDVCKENSRFDQQLMRFIERRLPRSMSRYIDTSIGRFVGLICLICAALFAVLFLIYKHHAREDVVLISDLQSVLTSVFVVFVLIAGVAIWIIILTQKSRVAAFKETAENLEKLHQEIEAHELTDAELQRAKQAAEAANLAKTRFLYSVSHEIRAPLNSIYGYSQLLEQDIDIVPQEAGRVIRRSSEHLTHLIDGLTDISQVEGGVLRLAREPVKLPALLEQIVQMFEVQATAKGLQFDYLAPANLPAVVMTDSNRLRQILINLLSNACKFTQSGRVGFKIGYRNDIARFDITDTGPGIAAEDQERIFEPFNRLEQPGGYAGTGIGLGLSITRALVNIMGGEVSVSSEPRAGSTFTVRLMLSRPRSDGEIVVEPVAAKIVAGGGVKVLMIDDEPNQLEVVRRLLTPMGFDFSAFDDPVQGLKAVSQIVPDIALLDVNMPQMSGWDVAKALRERFGAKIRIIMVSAALQTVRSVDPERQNHDRFLPKPFNFSDLIAALDVAAFTDEFGNSKVPHAEPAPVNSDQSTDQLASYSDILSEIRHFAFIGHIRGVRTGFQRLERMSPGDSDLIRKLSLAIEAFNMRDVVDLIDAYEVETNGD